MSQAAVTHNANDFNGKKGCRMLQSLNNTCVRVPEQQTTLYLKPLDFFSWQSSVPRPLHCIMSQWYLQCAPHYVSSVFSPTRPSGPSWSSSHRVCVSVCLYVCLSPSNAIFYEASHWSSDHTTLLLALPAVVIWHILRLQMDGPGQNDWVVFVISWNENVDQSHIYSSLEWLEQNDINRVTSTERH